MNYNLMVALAYSIVLPVLGILYQYNRTDAVYRPVMLLIIIGLANECVSTLLHKNGYQGAINNNIYALTECLLLLTLFKRWGFFEMARRLYPSLCFIFAGVWLLDNHSLGELQVFASLFYSLMSVTIVVMSIIQIHILIAEYEGRITGSASFIFCVAFCFYFCIALLLQIFDAFGKGASRELQVAVFTAYACANALTNIIYFIAILCIPRKQHFIA